MYDTCYVKRELKAFAKSIDPCQPAQSAQADMGRNFSLSFFFLHIQITMLNASTKSIDRGEYAGTFWPGRFSQDVLATDVLARYRYKVGRFGQILFQYGKKLHMNFLRFYTYSLCKTKS